MTEQLYIGNLPFQTEEEQVRRLCTPYGKVKSIDMITDRDTGRFRGFCFVEMEEQAIKRAIEALSGKKVGGRKIRVNKARSRKQKRPGKRVTKKGSEQNEERPLHERTQRGGYGNRDHFPHSGRGRGRSSRQDQGRKGGNGDFPDSGGSVRGNL